MRRLSLSVLIAALFFAPAFAEDWRFDDVARVVAVSDIHGDHDAFVATLQQSGVIDGQQRWAAGESHLVVNGDILDRGDHSRAAMELVMALETQAAEAGGRVHMVIGNHEAMVLIGDMRYVVPGEYAAFAEEETLEERGLWFDALVLRDGEQDRSAFDQAYPPGYFALRRAFAADGRYGQWLLDMPLLITINDTAFVHAGLSPKTTETGFDGVNGRLRDEPREYVELLPQLYADGVVLPTDNFFEHPNLLQQRIASLPVDDPRVAVYERAIALNKSSAHDSDSPYWYRGNIACSPLAETDRLSNALETIGASRAVVGHTPTPTRKVFSRLDSQLIEIDTGMNNGYYKGTGHALLFEGDSLTTVSEAGERSEYIPPHPRQVGTRPGGFLSLEDTLAVLRDGEISDQRVLETGEDVVTVTLAGNTLDAVFTPAERKGVMPELAAFRLDRFLGLEMVPATVERKLGRRAGTLQMLVPDTINEQQRSTTALGGGAQCPLPDQWTTMYAFDALVHNEARTQRSMVYDRVQGFKLMLTGHQRAFSTTRGFPAYLATANLAVTSEWRRRLEALTDDVIEEQFADVLDRRRRRALSGRRELMLEMAP